MNGTYRTPALTEYIEEWEQKQPLLEDIETLKREHAYLTETVCTLRDIEQSLRNSIVQLSHNLCQLYEMMGNMVTQQR